MKYILSSIFCLIHIVVIFSQANTFEITFTSCLETESTLNLNYLTENSTIYFNAYSETIKVDLTRNDYNSNAYFSHSIFNFLMDGELNAYALDRKTKLSLDEIKDGVTVIDTIVTFDPFTYIPSYRVAKNWLLDYISCYRILQKWTIGEKEISSQIIGITPIVEINGIEQELFWIPIIQKDEKVLINNPSISWIKTNEDLVSIPERIKSSKLFKDVIWGQPKRKEVPIYYSDFNIHLNNKDMVADYFDDRLLVENRDTVITFDPETYAETTEIVASGPIQYENINYLKLNQVFYIDSESKTIGCKLLGVAPLLERKDLLGDQNAYSLYQIIFSSLK